MDKRRFEELVARALEELPERFRERLDNVEVVVEDEPGRGLPDGMNVPRDATLLGLYHGVPLTSRGYHYGNVLPDRIVIYMGPILRSPRPAGGLEDLVREVVFHEVGHYFGLSERELAELEGRADGE